MDRKTPSKIGSVAGFLLAVAGLVFLLEKKYILSQNYAGMAVQVLAVALMLWARYTFGMRSFHAVANTTKGELVTTGPYRFFRHPIYAAIMYFVWAGVLSYPFAEAIAAAGLITFGLTLRLLLEESFLREAYPTYAAYALRTKRIIPFLF